MEHLEARWIEQLRSQSWLGLHGSLVSEAAHRRDAVMETWSFAAGLTSQPPVNQNSAGNAGPMVG